MISGTIKGPYCPYFFRLDANRVWQYLTTKRQGYDGYTILNRLFLFNLKNNYVYIPTHTGEWQIWYKNNLRYVNPTDNKIFVIFWCFVLKNVEYIQIKNIWVLCILKALQQMVAYFYGFWSLVESYRINHHTKSSCFYFHILWENDWYCLT